MATYTVVRVKSATLAANVIDSVSLSFHPSSVEVFNRGAVYLWFTVDNSTPVVAGDESYPVAPGQALRVDFQGPQVRLIASASCDYSVTGI